MLTGQNGILNRAVEAKEKTEKSNGKEKIQLEIMSSYDNTGKVDLEKLKLNLKNQGITTSNSNSFPLEVKMNGENIYIIEDGTIYNEIQAGKTVEGENKIYANNNNFAIIPVGFTVSGLEDEQSIENGLVIYDLEGNTVSNWNKDEDNDGLLDVQDQYNQFVWIPVKKGEYQRNYSYPIYVFNSEGHYRSDTTPVNSMHADIGYLPNIIQPSVDSATSNENSEMENVERVGGFYISRYEAGDGDATSERTSETTNGKTVSKQKSYVYNYITQEDAKNISKDMYNTGGARSALCSGIQWDCALNFVNGKTDAMNNVYLVRGYNENRHMNSVQKTGINNYDKVLNIYDLEGNCAEFVAERNTLNNYTMICRGGYWAKSYNDWSSNRATKMQEEKSNLLTFRMTLYII